MLSLTAAVLFAVYNLATRPLIARYGSAVTTFWGALLGLGLVTPPAAPSVIAQPWSQLSPAAWGSLLYAGALSMLVAYTLWAWAIARRGVGRTVPFMLPGADRLRDAGGTLAGRAI